MERVLLFARRPVAAGSMQSLVVGPIRLFEDFPFARLVGTPTAIWSEILLQFDRQ